MAQQPTPLDVPSSRMSLPQLERDTLKIWSVTGAFQKQNQLSEEANRPLFTFYDGPPFATGLPHYGHILAMTIKDTVTRYAYGQGFHVPRRFGWDCHGLPVEHEIDKEYGVKTKDDVLAMGVDVYNERCRSIVQRYSGEWQTTVQRMGRWIDFDKGYRTMDLPFMESVWATFASIYAKGLVYRGFKVMPYSTQCTTALSNFEANQNYQKVTDPTVVATFPIVGDADGAAFVAWTTTPWTLPSNLALCVNAGLTYVYARDKKTGQLLVLAKSRLEQVWPDKKAAAARAKALADAPQDKPSQARVKAELLAATPASTDAYEIVKEVQGAELVGAKYEPLFTYFAAEWAPTAFRVIADNYVTDDSGTGIVHCAPAFGEDDYRVCMQAGVITKGGALLCPVDDSGRLTAEVTDFAGRHVKEADLDIVRLLKKNNRVVRQDPFIHQYPFCWRSDTPLIYKAVPSWFIRVEALKERLLANLKQTSWVPDTVGDGRFHAWLRDARDWAVSRTRYWGTPIPIWMSADGTQTVVVGSVAELEAKAGLPAGSVTDIHKHKIDHITIPDPRGADFPPLTRITDVFDCWFESGSMPYAQQHYPFENKENFPEQTTWAYTEEQPVAPASPAPAASASSTSSGNSMFPAQFIAEGLDQTRGWFYTLHVLGAALFDSPAFKNVVVNGIVLASDKKKMSKRLKNYPDPNLLLEKHGADALRLFLINSPAVRAEEIAFKEEGVAQTANKVLRPWWHALRLLAENINRYQAVNGRAFTLGEAWIMDASAEVNATRESSAVNVTDRWILSALQTLTADVRREMEGYRLYAVVPRLVVFIDSLTNWYLRANRRRIKGLDGDVADCERALSTAATVLFSLCRIMAPFTPFVVESMYAVLRPILPPAYAALDSIHHHLAPAVNAHYSAPAVERAVARMQSVIELGRACRDKRTLSLKTPLRHFTIAAADAEYLADITPLNGYICDMLSVRDVAYETSVAGLVKVTVTANQSVLGRKLGKQLRAFIDHLAQLTGEQAAAVQKQETYSWTAPDGTAVAIAPATELTFALAPLDSAPHLEVLGGGAGIVVALDCTIDRALAAEGLAREIVSRVQGMRKRAGLMPDNKVEVYFACPDAAAYATAKAHGDALTLPLPAVAMDNNICVRKARIAAGVAVPPSAAEIAAGIAGTPAVAAAAAGEAGDADDEDGASLSIPLAEVLALTGAGISTTLQAPVLPVSELNAAVARVYLADTVDVGGQPLALTLTAPIVRVREAALPAGVAAATVVSRANALGFAKVQAAAAKNNGVWRLVVDGAAVELAVGADVKSGPFEQQ